MQGWKDIVQGKGPSRQPRPNPNFDKRQDQDRVRTLMVLQGGDPSELTHRPQPRRGSRARSGGGGRKLTRSESLAKQADADLREHQRCHSTDEESPHSAEVIDLAQFREQAHRGEMQHIAAPGTQCPQLEHPKTPAAEKQTDFHIWSEADFTPEALAAYDRELARNRELNCRDGAKFRREMEEAFLRFRGDNSAPSRSPQRDSGVFCNRLPLPQPQTETVAKPLPRAVLSASHQQRSSRSKK